MLINVRTIAVFLVVVFLASMAEAKIKYNLPRNKIPAAKTKYVRPYIRHKTGLVRSHMRAPKGSLKPYRRY